MEDPIIELFCSMDASMRGLTPHRQAKLCPREIVTLAVLLAVKGVSQRAFHRWLAGNFGHFFPQLPERTRLFRLMETHQDWSDGFLGRPTFLGVADTYGIELIHPIRQGRSQRPIGKKGLSNHRWMVGGKLGCGLNGLGHVCAWDCGTANLHDKHFRHLLRPFQNRMLVLTDSGFHGEQDDPLNMKVCRPRKWGCRMLIETVLSMLTVCCHSKRMHHRAWAYFRAHLGWRMAAFNLLIQRNPVASDAQGHQPFSIATLTL